MRLFSGRSSTALAGFVTASFLGLCATPTALAHDHLTGSVPSAGATVETAPAQLELRFSGRVLDAGRKIMLTGPNSKPTALTPTMTGTTLRAPLRAANSGRYHVAWRVTSADGHPISGDFDFTVRKGAGATDLARTATTSSSSPTVAGPTTPTVNEPGDNEPLLVITAFIGGVAALAGAWSVARRRVHDDPR